MKRLFGSSKPKKPTTNQPRNQLNRWQKHPRFWLLLFCGILIVILGNNVNLVSAQSDRSLKEQEDQLIREYTLPSAPTQTPVYKPIPPAPPKNKKPSTPATRKLIGPQPPPQQPQSPPRKPTPRPQTPEKPKPQPESQPKVRESVTSETEAPDQPRAKPRAKSPTIKEEETTTTEALPTAEYILQFNRSPVVGNRFRLRGIYSTARLGFTRPQGWKITAAKALIRYQHSPALIASRSNLTVQVNGTSIGSIPLNRKQSQIGQALFSIPGRLIQDYNDVTIVVQQQNDEKCSDPGDATLWTEVLPDSELQFEYQAQPIPLNFSRYPYPFFDQLSLDANKIVYLLPKVNDDWLIASSRLQAALGRQAEFRPIETSLVKDIEDLDFGDRVVVIGTPATQPALKDLDLPFPIIKNQILDGNKTPLPEDVGVLILTTTLDGAVPVLVVTGNGSEGVAKAAQFLVQPDTKKLGTGQAILVNSIKDLPAPPLREWKGFLPTKDSFKLSEIKTQENSEPLQDITVRGAGAPPVQIDFRPLPDDEFTRGSSMNLRYSYGPQVNPRTSAVEVLLDGVFIGGARLTSEDGATNKKLNVDLPANLMNRLSPTSKLEVAFRLNPREPGECGKVTDQQLTGTVHPDTSFKLNRQQSVQLPDLKLLQSGYPFTAPQDLSNTAIVVPDAPTTTDLLTMLAFSERLGRLSKADSVKIGAYTTATLPPEVRKTNNLVAIGTRDQFPLPEALTKEAGGFGLGSAFSRQSNQASIQTLPDDGGTIKEIISPDNPERVVLALSAQTENGLERVRQIISKDSWFFQLQKDTVLVSSNQENTSTYDPDAYKLDFLNRAPTTRRIENTSLLGKIARILQNNWIFLPGGILAIALLLYGISQLYLKRLSDQKGH